MSVAVLMGLQWGDEGKGKVVDAISGSMGLVVRAQGGANAGHTVKVGEESQVLHLVPSGMLYPSVRGLIGNGVVLDPLQLVKELDELGRRGHDLSGRLFISDRAHLVLPYHKDMDAAAEELRGAGRLGTTGRGIGPAYQDKAARSGIRAGELLDEASFATRVRAQCEAKNRILESLVGRQVDVDEILPPLLEARARLAPMILDGAALLLDEVDRGTEIMVEGAQGALLDLDLGTYPFVTSSNCHIGGLLAGSALPARVVDRVIGVTKAYCTRVGSGPFPTEDDGEAGERLGRVGREFGSTTGRPRRCGWIDLVAVRFAVRTNGVDEIALTKLDVLSGQPRIKVCTGYRLDGEVTRDFPQGDRLESVEPIYEELEGFEEDLADCRSEADLPAPARALIALIEKESGARVTLVSTGPERGQAFMRGEVG